MEQDVIQQVLVTVRWDPVNFVVRRHHGPYAAFLHGGLERRKKVFANDTLGVIAGGDVRPTLGLSVDGKVFRGGEHVLLVDERSFALEAANGRDSNARGQIRILPVRFLGTSPARIAGQIEHWCQAFLRAASSHFGRGGGEYVVHKGRIPRGG